MKTKRSVVISEESLDALEKRVETLEQKLKESVDRENGLVKAIKIHRAQKGDDRCWLDDVALYRAAGFVEDYESALPPKKEFMKNCEHFYECRQNKKEHEYKTVESRLEPAKLALKKIIEVIIGPRVSLWQTRALTERESNAMTVAEDALKELE